MLMLICCKRKTLLNDWLILADKLKRTGPSERAHGYPAPKDLLAGAGRIQISSLIHSWLEAWKEWR
jgi:hypothetical protein